MRPMVKGAAVAAAAGAMIGGLAAIQKMTKRRDSRWPSAYTGWPTRASRPETVPRWHAVTINRPQNDVTPDGRLPDPIAELGDRVEVQTCPAPGDRGTILAVRLRPTEPRGIAGAVAKLRGEDPRYAVRSALRRSKQLIETGEILSPNRPTTTKRTITNRPLQFAISHGREDGRI